MSESYSPQGAQDFYYDFWGQVSEPEPEAEQPDAEYNASQDLFVSPVKKAGSSVRKRDSPSSSRVIKRKAPKRRRTSSIIVPGYSDWYNIKYSGDPAIYTYQLLKDYSQGDLELLVQ
ncbi:uncharacterized protein LOC127862924 [Dreissena polymorpha]|uniref:uncharacterized protein LOC127862924 n=1 Tax=Dreissena polymorpha TaxID=45954 RepID=UPI0022646F51|nr:uncharacterized protein LOC127862924 [Dreissena polymorpha]